MQANVTISRPHRPGHALRQSGDENKAWEAVPPQEESKVMIIDPPEWTDCLSGLHGRSAGRARLRELRRGVLLQLQGTALVPGDRG